MDIKEKVLIKLRDLEISSELHCPVPFGEDFRMSLLKETRLLDTVPELDFDKLTSIVASVFKVPICLVSLIDSERQWFKSNVGLNGKETHRDVAFCSYTILEQSPDVFVVLDALKDPRFMNNPLSTGPPYVIFYAGAALYVKGHKLGSLCIIDHVPRQSFSLSEKKLLFDFGVMVSDLLISRRRTALQTAPSVRSKIQLSVVHNVNTLANGLSMSSSILDSKLKEVGTTMNVDSNISLDISGTIQEPTKRIVRNMCDIVELSKILPSFLSETDKGSMSAFGPKCNVLPILRMVVTILSPVYSSITFNIIDEMLATTSQYVFIEVFIQLLVTVLQQSFVQACEAGQVKFEFEEKESYHDIGEPSYDFLGDLSFTITKKVSSSLPGNIVTLSEEMQRSLDMVLGEEIVSLDESSRDWTYCIKIPCALRAGMKSRAVSADIAVPSKVTTGGRLRVLIADDNPSVRREMEMYLRIQGCDVVTVRNGREGVSSFREAENSSNQYDIAFVDLLMPVMNGIEMLKVIKETYSSTSTLFIGMIGSASQCDQFIQDCDHDPMAIGFSFLYSKPIREDFMQWVVDDTRAHKNAELIPIEANMKSSIVLRMEAQKDLPFLSYIRKRFAKSSKIVPT